MDPRAQQLADAMGLPTTQQEIDPQDQILQFNFSIREATMILNKMNTATFNGFGEAGQAMQIFAKIQATVKDGALAEKKPEAVRQGSSFTKPTPVTPPSRHSEPEKTDDVNTAAPMAAVSEVQQPVSEDAAPSSSPDDAPPEEAGAFSVIDKRGDI